MKSKTFITLSVLILIIILISCSLILINNKKTKTNINNQTQEIIKKEDKSDNFELKELSIKENEEYTIDLFIDKDKSDMKLTFEYESKEMGNYKEDGEYTIKITSKDENDNTTTKETKLIITKKEENKTTSSSSTTSKTQTTKPSTQKPNTSTGTTQTPTTQAPATQPVSDDLYYNIYYPNGIKNPKLTGKSEAEYNSIYNSGGIVAKDGDIHKVVSSFNAQIGGSYTVAYVDKYYDKSQDNFKGYYVEGRVYVNQTISLMLPDNANPYYDSLTYKEDGNGRLVGTWYYTNASGSRQWLWNPNNLHF